MSISISDDGANASTLYAWDDIALTLDRFAVSTSGLALAQQVPGVTIADGLQYKRYDYLESGAV